MIGMIGTTFCKTDPIYRFMTAKYVAGRPVQNRFSGLAYRSHDMLMRDMFIYLYNSI